MAVDTSDTRLLSSPAITEGKIAFVYADDIWVANADGTGARRLTSHPGEEQNPHFAPDGKHIAFTASYDGNVDVYVVPVEGGEPKRLTWHPGDDIVRGFTPDGKVLFTSQRAVFTGGIRSSSRSASRGAFPQPLPVPTGDMGAISPDGKHLAYTPLGERFRQWKNYRGGTASRIWVLKLSDLSHEEIPKPTGGCNDTQPMWIGQTVYFLSDRDGEFNLYSYDPRTRNVVRRTSHDDFPMESASAGAGKVIYEQAGYLHLFDPELGPFDPVEDRRGGRPGGNTSAIREQRQGHPLGRHLAHGKASRGRVPRRDRDRAGQERRSAQPHRDTRRSRALARLVARRQVDRLLLRRLG